MPDLNGWKQVGYYGSYFIYASGDIRRLVDPATGRIITQYNVNHAGESEIVAGFFTENKKPEL